MATVLQRRSPKIQVKHADESVLAIAILLELIPEANNYGATKLEMVHRCHSRRLAATLGASPTLGT